MKDLRVIIVGGGRVGTNAARALDDQGHSLVIIESDPDRCTELSDEYMATVIEGNGTYPEILAQADPTKADVIAGLTGEIGTNLSACILARRENPEIRTVMRVDTPVAAEAYGDLVDSVIYPERAGGVLAANVISGSGARAIELLSSTLEIHELEVADDAPVAGRTLKEVELPRGALVLSDETGSRIAGYETELVAGHTYVVVVEPEVTEEVHQLFRG